MKAQLLFLAFFLALSSQVKVGAKDKPIKEKPKVEKKGDSCDISLPTSVCLENRVIPPLAQPDYLAFRLDSSSKPVNFFCLILGCRFF